MFEEGMPNWIAYALLGLGVVMILLASAGVLR